MLPASALLRWLGSLSRPQHSSPDAKHQTGTDPLQRRIHRRVVVMMITGDQMMRQMHGHRDRNHRHGMRQNTGKPITSGCQ